MDCEERLPFLKRHRRLIAEQLRDQYDHHACSAHVGSSREEPFQWLDETGEETLQKLRNEWNRHHLRALRIDVTCTSTGPASSDWQEFRRGNKFYNSISSDYLEREVEGVVSLSFEIPNIPRYTRKALIQIRTLDPNDLTESVIVLERPFEIPQLALERASHSTTFFIHIAAMQSQHGNSHMKLATFQAKVSQLIQREREDPWFRTLNRSQGNHKPSRYTSSESQNWVNNSAHGDSLDTTLYQFTSQNLMGIEVQVLDPDISILELWNSRQDDEAPEPVKIPVVSVDRPGLTRNQYRCPFCKWQDFRVPESLEFHIRVTHREAHDPMDWSPISTNDLGQAREGHSSRDSSLSSPRNALLNNECENTTSRKQCVYSRDVRLGSNIREDAADKCLNVQGSSGTPFDASAIARQGSLRRPISGLNVHVSRTASTTTPISSGRGGSTPVELGSSYTSHSPRPGVQKTHQYPTDRKLCAHSETSSIENVDPAQQSRKGNQKLQNRAVPQITLNSSKVPETIAKKTSETQPSDPYGLRKWEERLIAIQQMVEGTDNEILKASKASASAIAELDRERREIYKRRPKFTVPKARAGVNFFRSITKRVLREDEELSESEDEPDDSWVWIAHAQELNETSASALEKKFMRMFNETFRKLRVPSDQYFWVAWIKFTLVHLLTLARKDLLPEYIKKTASLVNDKLLDMHKVDICMRTLVPLSRALERDETLKPPRKTKSSDSKPNRVDRCVCGELVGPKLADAIFCSNKVGNPPAVWKMCG